jgi:hypothetical protein
MSEYILFLLVLECMLPIVLRVPSRNCLGVNQFGIAEMFTSSNFL